MTWSYDNQVLLGLFSQCNPPSCTLQKRPSSPIQFGREENIPGHPTERRAYWFILKIANIFSIPASRMMNTFIIINITPTYKRLFKDKYVFPIQKCLPSPFSLARNRIYLRTHLKEELTNLFWKLPLYSLFPHRQRRKECEHFANGKHLPLYVRDSLADKWSISFTLFYPM